MRPYFIEQRLKLRNPIYSETAAYGHMGRKPEVIVKTFISPEGKQVKRKVELFTWEKLDYVPKLKKGVRIEIMPVIFEKNFKTLWLCPRSFLFDRSKHIFDE